jgi:hypothetical protein
MKNKKILKLIKKSKNPLRLLKKWKAVFKRRIKKSSEESALRSANAIVRSELLKEFLMPTKSKKSSLTEEKKLSPIGNFPIGERTSLILLTNGRLLNEEYNLYNYKGKIKHITENYVKEIFRKFYKEYEFIPEENLYYVITDLNEANEKPLYKNSPFLKFFKSEKAFKAWTRERDPTATDTRTGKFTGWLAVHRTELFEPHIVMEVLNFFKNKKNFDLYNFRSFDELLEYHKKFKEKPELKPLFNINGNRFYRINTFDESKYYGSINWCISRNIEDWDKYKNDLNKFYFLITPNTKWAIQVNNYAAEAVIWSVKNKLQGTPESKRAFVKKYKSLVPKIEEIVKRTIMHRETKERYINGIRKGREKIEALTKTFEKYGAEASRELTKLCIKLDIKHGLENSVEIVDQKEGKIIVDIRNHSIYIHDKKIKSLRDFFGPIIVINKIWSDFTCQVNNLVSLEGGPKSVTGNYDFQYNKIKSLKGIAQFIGKNINGSYNQLTDLKGLPKDFKGIVYLDDNPISDEEVEKYIKLGYNIKIIKAK